MSELILPGALEHAPEAPNDPADADEAAVMRVIGYALQHAPERLSIFPVLNLLMEWARSNDKRTAYLKIATLDSVVVNAAGNPKLRDYYFMLRIPREIGDRAFSPIVQA